jgi:hypothetical protein
MNLDELDKSFTLEQQLETILFIDITQQPVCSRQV